MRRAISNFLQGIFFYAGVALQKVKLWKPKIKHVKKMSARQRFETEHRARYQMHALLKEGDSYQLGSAKATLAKFGPEGKAEVKAKLALMNQRREERARKHRERAIDIMMMTPEELEKFQIDEWLEKRRKEIKFYDNFSAAPDAVPPSGDPSKRVH